jgi:hypothetical protein
VVIIRARRRGINGGAGGAVARPRPQKRVKGIEPCQKARNRQQNEHFSHGGAAKGAVGQCPPMLADADLVSIVNAWPVLSAPIRAAVLALIKASTPTNE